MCWSSTNHVGMLHLILIFWLHGTSIGLIHQLQFEEHCQMPQSWSSWISCNVNMTLSMYFQESDGWCLNNGTLHRKHRLCKYKLFEIISRRFTGVVGQKTQQWPVNCFSWLMKQDGVKTLQIVCLEMQVSYFSVPTADGWAIIEM